MGASGAPEVQEVAVEVRDAARIDDQVAVLRGGPDLLVTECGADPACLAFAGRPRTAGRDGAHGPSCFVPEVLELPAVPVIEGGAA